MPDTERTEILADDNGPYIVKGSFTVVLANGRTLQTDGEAWLCRCGGSKTKPFCDDSHLTNGFQSDAAEMSAIADAAEAAGEGAGFQAVADESAIGEGDLIGAEVDGVPVVIGRVKGHLYAIGGICSHAHARLEDGELDGEVVMCPLHNSGFDIRTGQAIRLPATDPVPRYDVKVEEGQVLVSRQAISLEEA